MKINQKLLYYLKYFLSCLTILPIIMHHKWVKQIKDVNSLTNKVIIDIVLLCQTYRNKITKIFSFFNQKNKNNYVNLILKRFLIFEINVNTFKDFLRLNECFDIVVTKFLKIGQKKLNIYQQEIDIFKNQMNFYIKTINYFLSEIKFNFKIWPKKFLKKIYLQIDNI